MTTKEKFEAKKLYKQWRSVSYVCVLLFFFELVVVGYLLKHNSKIHPLWTAVVLTLYLFFPCLAGMYADSIARKYKRKLIQYKNDILRYRTRKMFAEFLDCIEQRNTARAVWVHNKFLVNNILGTYSYSILLGFMFRSPQLKQRQKAVNKMRCLQHNFDFKSIFTNKD